jgi:hypothetical protein
MNGEEAGMSAWNSSSQRVSEFVDKFLDRALGASNDVRQRVPVYDPLERKFYIGKLLPMAVNIGGSEYKAKVAPCSYIATFLIKGQPQTIALRVIPSFNLYFRPAIKKAADEETVADPATLNLYSAQADPAPPANDGRSDMWIPWQDRLRPVPAAYTAALAALRAPQGSTNRLHSLYNRASAIDAYIRKRYCTVIDLELPGSGAVGSVEKELDLEEFRTAYSELGSSPEWCGLVKAVASPDGGNTRITLYLENTFGSKNSRSGDPNWYDTHLRVELLTGLDLEPVSCPVLDDALGTAPLVYAETRNCALDSLSVAAGRHTLTFTPAARTRTIRRVARELGITFGNSAEDPARLLNAFNEALQAQEAAPDTLEFYSERIGLILSDTKAVAAIGMVSNVYARVIGEGLPWRFHQVAALIQASASYLKREAAGQAELNPLVLNVPTAGGKTESFFAAAMFCAFYELQRRRRSVSIIKYPMTLLSSDQIARLSRYSMVADEIAGYPLGIGYMVGGKGKYNAPSEVIERCPYPDASKSGGMCGEEWQDSTFKAGIPTLKCPNGHSLHLGIDKDNMLTQQCPAFIVSTWDKFVSQSTQRHLGMLFGSKRYQCPKHGFIDFADTNQQPFRGRPAPPEIICRCYENGQACGATARLATPISPGVLVFDEGHLIREAAGTLDSHFETAYLQIARDLSGKFPIPIVSTATIAGIKEFMEQLGLSKPGVQDIDILPKPGEQDVFFQPVPGEMQHEAIALVPFDVMLTWAAPDLMDVFFETLASDYGYEATDPSATPPLGLEHLQQIMAYCSSYKNISALGEMNRNAVASNRRGRGKPMLTTTTLSSRAFDRRKAQAAIEDVMNMRQQIVYATNIASIGIDIDNLDVIFFFGLPSNVSEFIQAMNRTGRRAGRPAVCVAILGPNRERDMSYYRYWPQFIASTGLIVEPIPLNRFASAAVERTFNNVATALILMEYMHTKGRKLFNAGDIRDALRDGTIPEAEMLEKLRAIYKVSDDPAQEYSGKIDELWSTYTASIDRASRDTFIGKAFGDAWMLNLRAKQRQIRITYPDVADVVERNGSGALFTGDVDTEAVADVMAVEAVGESAG